MHLTGLVEYPDHVCCRYRLAAFRPFLERGGHELKLASRLRPWWRRLLDAGRARHDVVILQRRLLPGPELRFLRRNCRKLIFDFDDAVWLRDSFARGGLNSRRRLRRFAATIRAADAVVAGNDFLANQAQQFAHSCHIHVIPTCVDPALYPLSDHRQSDGLVRMVWIGSASTLQGLEWFGENLEEIGKSVRNLRLKLICNRFLNFTHLPVDSCLWNEATEAAEIAAADIGIAWMPEDDWSHGKCGLKVLQYMTAGLPVVANPIGVHREFIVHGETGFLATTRDEWIEAIRLLADNASLRSRMGTAGRKIVERRFSIECGGGAWLRLLASLEQARHAA